MCKCSFDIAAKYIKTQGKIVTDKCPMQCKSFNLLKHDAFSKSKLQERIGGINF